MGGAKLSATAIVKFAVPAGPVGVPLITPVVGFNVSPFGRLPVCTANVNGAVPVPAFTETVVVYATPTVPLGRAADDNTGAVATTVPEPVTTSKSKLTNFDVPA